MTLESKTVTYGFTTYAGAVEALIVVLEDARKTMYRYRITGKSPETILANGLLLEGEIDAVSEKIALISGAKLRG